MTAAAKVSDSVLCYLISQQAGVEKKKWAFTYICISSYLQVQLLD